MLVGCYRLLSHCKDSESAHSLILHSRPLLEFSSSLPAVLVEIFYCLPPGEWLVIFLLVFALDLFMVKSLTKSKGGKHIYL